MPLSLTARAVAYRTDSQGRACVNPSCGHDGAFHAAGGCYRWECPCLAFLGRPINTSSQGAI
jgi:hypothetical protein